MVSIDLYNIDSRVAIYKSTGNKYSICVRFKSNHPTGYTIAMIVDDRNKPVNINCYLSTHIHDNNISGWEFVKFINNHKINSIFEPMKYTIRKDDASDRFKSWFPIDLDNELTVDEFNNIIFFHI